MKRFALVFGAGILLAVLGACDARVPEVEAREEIPAEVLSQLRETLQKPDYIKLSFGEPYLGYLITAELHPDEGCEEVGVARFHFSGHGGKFVIETPYYWRWRRDVSLSPSTVPEDRPIHWVRRLAGIEQEGASDEAAGMIPFCFKDIDHDGEKEICISLLQDGQPHYAIFRRTNPSRAQPAGLIPQ